MKSIFSKDFRYVPASKTDLRKTFARVRREQEEARKQEAQREAVTPLRKVAALSENISRAKLKLSDAK